MKSIDVRDEELEEVELLGIRALFTELRINKSTIPEGMYCYGLRHGDDDSFPSTVENKVVADYYGSILTTEKLDLGTEDFLPINYDDFGFTGEVFYAEDFLEKSKLQSREVHEPDATALTAAEP